MKYSLKNNIYNLFLITIAILFSFVLSEILLRLFWLPNQPTNPRLACEYDAELGWRKIPNKSVLMKTKEYAVNEHINLNGLRGPVYPYKKTENSIRILLLGDSFVEGYSVDDAHLFSNLLEYKLQAKTNQKIETINMGTGGYSTDQEYLIYFLEGTKYQPDIVLLFFYYNDLLYNIKSEYDNYPKPYFTESQGSIELKNVPIPKTTKFSKTKIFFSNIALLKLTKKTQEQLFCKFGDKNKTDENETDCFLKLTPLWVERAWFITELIFTKLNSLIVKTNGKLVVVYVPAYFEIDPELSTRPDNLKAQDISIDQVSLRLKTMCHKNKINFFALTPELIKNNKYGPLYYRIDGHWNIKGHQMVADLLSRQLSVLISMKPLIQQRMN